MNSVQILGTMTRDCEIRYTPAGTAVGKFGIGYNERIKDASGQYQDKAHFFEITAWGKSAENISSFFKKGSRILIQGSLDFSTWEKDGQKHSKVGIKLERFDFIEKRADQQSSYQQPAPQQQAPQQGGYAQSPAQQQVPQQQVPRQQVPQQPTAEQIAAYMLAQSKNPPAHDSDEEIPF